MSGSSPQRPFPSKLILGSASPRRREILEAAGFEFDVVPAAVSEQQREGETPQEFVCRIAAEKARRTLSLVPPPCRSPVLAADTVVMLDEHTQGKPTSLEGARWMLRLLSGKEHQVLTGVCLIYPLMHGPIPPDGLRQDIRFASTTVKFRELAEEEIEQYVATGEPLDKAGAYAIQGRASLFVEWIHGCYFNVVGLPISLVYQMLQDLASALREEKTPEGQSEEKA